jgi:hypothetical protein
MILQHYIEVIQIEFDDADGKTGKYALRLFPEVRPLDSRPLKKKNPRRRFFVNRRSNCLPIR